MSNAEKEQTDCSGESAVPYFTPPPRRDYRHLLCCSAAARLRFCLGEEEASGTRFLFLPFFLGVGIISYFTLPFEPDWSEAAALCAGAAGLVRLLRRCRTGRIICSFLLAAAIGFLCAKAETARRATIMLEKSGFTHITARIAAIEQQEKGDYRLIVTLLASRDPALRPAPQYLRLSARRLPAAASLGSGLEGLVFLRRFTGPAHPGGYDFAFHNYFRGIGGQGNFVGVPKLLSLPPPRLAEQAALQLAALRRLVSRHIRSAIGGETGAVAAALITGERSGISAATNQALRLSGLAHILSISGLHMALVSGMVLLFCRRLFGLFPLFFSRRSAGKIAAFVALCVAALYLALSGADVAAERSFVMVAVMLTAIICDRAAISLRNLALSACVILLWQPHEIMGPSFQMSFAATAALISAFAAWSRYRRGKAGQAERAAAEQGLPRAVYKPLSGVRAHIHARLLAPLISTCVSSVLAGSAGGLYSAYHFNNTAPYGLVSNALALPLMSMLVMPFALLGTVLMPLHLEVWPFRIMAVGLNGVEKLAYWVAGFSPGGNPGFISPSCLLLVSGGMIILVFLQTGLRWFGLIFIALGGAVYAATPLPLALAAENGRLIAAFNADKTLSLSNNRPSAFLVRDWQRAFAMAAALPPIHSGGEVAGAKPAALDSAAFACRDAFCRIRLRNGAVLALASAPPAEQQACREGDIIVLNFMAGNRPAAAACKGKTVVAGRDLALLGAAELRLPLWRPAGAIKLVWAVGAPLRPWNAYRRFSRRARDMPS